MAEIDSTIQTLRNKSLHYHIEERGYFDRVQVKAIYLRHRKERLQLVFSGYSYSVIIPVEKARELAQNGRVRTEAYQEGSDKQITVQLSIVKE